MACFLALPDEILSDILHSLLQKGPYNPARVSPYITDLNQRVLWQKDLCNLARVSPRLTDLTLQILYRSIRLDLTPPGKGYYKKDRGNLHRFARLVQTLSQNPHLRLYISTLSIKLFNHSSHERFEDHDSLLSLVPNVKSLSLNPPLADFGLSDSVPFLEELSLNFRERRMEIALNGIPINERKDPLEIIARKFWAPRLRKLHINDISFTPEMSVLFPPDRYRTASMTDLRFYDSGEHIIGCLPHILSCVKALERFTLETLTSWEVSHTGTSAMAPGLIGQPLRIHADTLTHLEIAASDAAEFPTTSLFGSLAGYPKLKRLAIPEPFLVVVDDKSASLVEALPPNIEELQLQFPMLFKQGQDENRAIRIKRLEQVAAAKFERFPALRRVIWWFQPAECWADGGSILRYGPVTDMHYLTAIFESVGVAFEWDSEPYFEDTPFGYEDDEKPDWYWE